MMRNLLKNESGQAIVEYILMLSVVVGVIGIIGTGFRRLLGKVWERMARDISAPCPGCQPDPQVRLR